MIDAERALDPRIRRTRQLLQQALETVLGQKDFDKVSVSDIADAATVNRVTFYAHYPDKYALLEALVETRFNEVLERGNVQFDGTCATALFGIVRGVCDYLTAAPGACRERQAQAAPHLESAVIAVVRRMIVEGLKKHPYSGQTPAELVATTLSWAIYGAAQEWTRTPDRAPIDTIVKTIVDLVTPIMVVAGES